MKEQEARALAEQLGAQLKAMREAGLDAAEISAILTARAKAKGVDVEVRVVSILPGLDGLEVKVNVKDAAELARGPDAPTAACRHPHWLCPACKADVCFGGDRPKGPRGVCSNCGAFLRTEVDPVQVFLMTDEELLALSDDERIRLQRGRRVVEQLRQSRGA